MPFDDFIGNAKTIAALRGMLAEDRLAQTILFAGPLGVGKATLTRFLAAAVNCDAGPADDFCGSCSSCLRILAADLSLDEYVKQREERQKLPAAKRAEAPLIVSTHPDFLIFPPDGPLRLIGMEQARQLRKAAQYNPSEGKRRVFHIDHADRANLEAANSLLKTLEEPAEMLTIVLTSENPYELLPTIRSRTVPFYFSPLSNDEMQRYFESRPEIPQAERRRLAGWSQGSPGRSLALDAEEYLARRDVMLTLLKTALRETSFAELIGRTESIARKSRERLGLLVEMLQALLSDLLHLRLGSGRLTNADIREDLRELAERTPFEWLDKAAVQLEELAALERRNIQKQVALEAYALGLRRQAAAG